MIESNRPDFRTRGPLFPGTSCFPLSPDMDMVQRGFAFPISDNDQIKKIFDILGSPS